MEPFSGELLTILVLISVSWAGVTCLAIIIAFIVYLCLLCSRRRHRLKSIKPTPVPSRSSPESFSTRSPSITPVQSKVTVKKMKQPKSYPDTVNVIHEQPYTSYSNEHKHQQREYIQDRTNETTARLNHLRTYEPRQQQQRQYAPQKPRSDLKVNERQTPYPPDVIARDKLMKNFQFAIDKK